MKNGIIPGSALLILILVCGCISEAKKETNMGENGLPKENPDRFSDDNGTVVNAKWTNPQDCATKTNPKKDLCYVNTATDMKDTSLCEKIQAQNYKEICYGRVGVATRNPSLCDKISDQSIRRQCYAAIVDVS